MVGILGAIADGMASGLGWGMGMRMMDGLFGPRTMEVVHHNEGNYGGSLVNLSCIHRNEILYLHL